MKLISKCILLTSLFFVFIAQKSKASHAVGADLTYVCLGDTDGNGFMEYEFTLNFYFACSSTFYPPEFPELTISAPGCGPTYQDIMFLSAGPNEVSQLCPGVVSDCDGGDAPGVERFVYTRIVEIAGNCSNWVVSFSECCRNATITNLANPDQYQLYVEVGINNENGLCNDSPVFTSLPVPYFCTYVPANYNHGVTEPNGDNLEFSLINAMDFGGGSIPYVGGFTFDFPISTDPGDFNFDTQTGTMNFIPTDEEIDVVTIRVDEYDAYGNSIGYITRDIQVILFNCLNDTPIFTFSENTEENNATFYSSNSATVCADDTVAFIFTASDPDIFDSLTISTSLLSQFPGAQINQVDVGNDSVYAEILIIPTNANTGFNQISIELNDNACPLPAQQLADFNLEVFNSASSYCTAPDCPDYFDATILGSVCNGDDVTIQVADANLLNISYTWSDGATTETNTVFNSNCLPETYTINVVANCIQDATQTYQTTLTTDVYPTDIASLFTLIEEDCEVGIEYISPDCENQFFTYPYYLPTNIQPGESGTIGMYILYAEGPGCTGEIEAELAYDCPLTPTCEITNFTASAFTCNDQDGSFMVEIDAFGNELSSSFELNGFGTYNYADLPIVIGPFAGDNSTVYNFEIFDSADNSCTASTSVGPILCEIVQVCDLANLTIEGICNGVDLATFDVYISFDGTGTYDLSDSDGNILLTDISSGQNIFVGAYPNLAEVDIIVSSTNVANCESIVTIECMICDPDACNSVAGTITVDQTNVCWQNMVIADADDFILMPKQSVYYLFHSQSSVSINDLPDPNTEVYTTGSFLFNDGSIIPCSTTVYVTAIGAMADPNFTGFPNYNDICLTVGNTVPINLLCPISIITDEECDQNTGEFTLSFEITGGFESEPYNVNGNFFNGIVNAGDLVLVGPIIDGESYEIEVVDANGCEGAIIENIQCEKVPIELIDFKGKSTNNGNLLTWSSASEINNDFYTLSFSLDGNSFEKIVQLNGAGTSSQKNDYQFLHYIKNYSGASYKLSQTDFDGKSEELGIVFIDVNNLLSFNFEVFPLPFENELNIALSNNDGDVFLSFYDTKGRLIEQKTYSNLLNNSNLSISLNNLEGGVYLLEIQTGNSTITKRILKK